ncbi:MAG: type IX secretion system sortase PorU [Dysgonamonadaceae bacterium]|nr:type IX secretion system sortase PorU [Dysgonamonadaceae bacterium]
MEEIKEIKRIKEIKGIKKIGIALLLFSFFSFPSFSADYASSSVLATGKWVQLKVLENAIYKLTYDDIKKMGFNDPSKIKIYGYGGWILEQNFTKPYIDDLPETAVWINKGNDNLFNSGDYLLFYGRGTVKWTYNSSNDFFEHENNPYSTYGSYFITENEQGPKEMSVQNSYSNTSTEVTTFDDYQLHEKELKAIINSGRELFGESFSGNPSQNFTFSIPGITNDPGKVCLSFAGGPQETKTVFLSIEDKQILSLNITAKGDYKKADQVTGVKPWLGDKSENTTVKIDYNSTGISYLNYISLNMKRNLRFYNNAYALFRDKASRNSALKYTIDNASSSCLVFDITDIQDIRLVQTSLNGSKLSFGANTKGIVSEYVMVDISKSFPVPEVMKEIKNQNLHALPQTDMVIIVPEGYVSFAETLAEKHRNLQGLRVTVVQPKQIYNEFSSGVPDATAYRRFMKMFYDRAKNENEKPKYLLLYGDGIFDNRHLTVPKIDNQYYLLTYQVQKSADESYSYGTDDYFGFLDDNEGVNLDSNQLDIGIGRFPVNSYEQAENALNKVIAYMDNTNYGQWKNTVIFTADDTDSDDKSFLHVTQADELARYVEEKHPEYNVKKSYMDAFQPQDVNGKRSYPDAKKKLLATLKEGCFLMNYTGHGNTKSISGEDMMYITDIRSMNFENLPLWITATCDFGWFDGIETSAGEEVFLNKKSGGIALFTTTRVVSSDGNFKLNRRLIQNIFTAKKDGKHLCLGDIIRQSKLEIGVGTNKLNYVLLGDPALRLSYPESKVQLDRINGKVIDENEIVNFPALEKMTLEGQIVDETGTSINEFNGILYTAIYDAKQTIESVTTRVRKISENKDTTVHFNYTDYSNIVYVGNNKVENGHFSFSFYVPQDISYTKDLGKMIFYASDESEHTDASGMFQKCTFYGTSDDFKDIDKRPEIITMFLNNQSFKDGSDVNETPFFYAEVIDETGINITGNSSGHDISIHIDNTPPQRFYVLNNYYQPENAQKGNIGFSIPALPEGEHELVFKVWNILNNSTSASLRFNVVKGLKPEIYNLSAHPNPAKEKTVFRLEYDRPEVPVEVEIRIYDLTGRLIWSHLETGASSYPQSYPIEWNLTNNAGSKVNSGVYIYQALIKTAKGKETTKSKKIIVL